jgi:hypothetical protein
MIVAFLSSCQSSRLPVWFTPGAAYHAFSVKLSPSNDSVVSRSHIPAAEVLEQPVLTAVLPIEKESKEAPIINHPRHSPIAKALNKPLYQSYSPDTISTRRSSRPTPSQMRDGDAINIVIHVIGAVFLIIAAVFIIASLGATGWGALGAFVYGGLFLGIGLAFLLFKSRKSTSYVMRQEQRAARKANKNR